MWTFPLAEIDSRSDRHAEVAYESIAPVYDDFTAHHDYETWIAMLLELAAENGLRRGASRALDVGCGTGKSFIPLLDRGWEVTGCDISASMVALAREKVGDRVPLEVVDMREMPVLGSFDLVFCIDDAINYLHSAEELEAALRGMAANLAPDGLLIFDSNTISIYRGFFAEHVEVEAGGVRMIWDGHGARGPAGRHQRGELLLRTAGGRRRPDGPARATSAAPPSRARGAGSDRRRGARAGGPLRPRFRRRPAPADERGGPHQGHLRRPPEADDVDDPVGALPRAPRS